MMEFFSPFFTSVRFHWPMQGPQALASTTPPTLVNVSVSPSRVIVALTCSEPGVMKNLVLDFKPLASACLAMDAARVMSS